MIIKVTSKHITAARKEWMDSPCSACMVAKALLSKRVIKYVSVGFSSCDIHYKSNKVVFIGLPDFVRQNIQYFTIWAASRNKTYGKRPKPFQFEIPDVN